MTGKYEKRGKLATIITITALSALLFFALGFSLFNMNWNVVITQPQQIEVNNLKEIQPPTAKCVGTVIKKQGFNIPVKMVSQTQNGDLATCVYEAKWLWFTEVQEFVVKVNNFDKVAPTIDLTPLDKPLLPNEEYVEPGYFANDDRDGDITDDVHVFQSYDKIVYYVTDAAGNPAFAERDIVREDTEAPVITLKNGSSISVCKDLEFTDPGFSASDNVDGDLTDRVVVSGAVDMSTIGSYEIQYKVYDNSNNCSVIKRTVHVVERLSDEGVGKTIYLTFDDGPSSHTRDLLNVLAKYKIKATFFVVGTGTKSIMKEIVAQGHAIGMHSTNHSYKTIYASEEAFLEDMYAMQKIIQDETGVLTTLLRFPGGSSNTVSKSYCDGVMTVIAKKVEELGFQYFDWNVSSGDAGGTTTKDGVFNNVTSGISKLSGDAVVLQHDTKKYSVEAVEEIIIWGLEHGYSFAALDMNSPTAHHPINN